MSALGYKWDHTRGVCGYNLRGKTAAGDYLSCRPDQYGDVRSYSHPKSERPVGNAFAVLGRASAIVKSEFRGRGLGRHSRLSIERALFCKRMAEILNDMPEDTVRSCD